jgi:alpha-L-fucosidase 2
MKKSTTRFRPKFLFAGLFTTALFSGAAAPGRAAPPAHPQEMVVWYKQPGTAWLQGMPLGNGRIGAMIFGGLPQERIALNESSFWSGRPHDYDDPNAAKYFDPICDLVSAQKFQEAEQLANDHFRGVPYAQEAYQPIGDLTLDFEPVETSEYRRELDMQRGVAKVSYRVGDAVLTRETFVSYPDGVLVTRISADKPGRVSFSVQFKGPYQVSSVADGNRLVADGQWKGPFPPPRAGNPMQIARTDGVGLRYEAALSARRDGGTSEAANTRLSFHGANAVTLVVALATSFKSYQDISADPAAHCQTVLDAAAGKDFAALERRHVDDFQALMSRVNLTVGEPARSAKPTDERLKEARAGAVEPNLQALIFQFGRYIAVSSSRAGGQPSNLQAIWDEALLPSWGSKYTLNINLQMNYWLTEVANLTECNAPLFELIKDLTVTGARTAKAYYNRDGWVAHHNTDLWRGTAPVDYAMPGLWPMGGAWLCQHLWEHYLYTGDEKFLREYYPVMRGAAQFFSELLVEEPTHHWLVTPVSMSPEHRFQDQDGKPGALSPGPTMDIAILRELYAHCIEAERILHTDEGFGQELADQTAKFPPYRINSRGYLQEWIEDWAPGNEGHNLSPNFTFFPGTSITLRGTPELAAAINRWMNDRRSSTSWQGAWDTCVWARLERPDRVERWLKAYAGAVADNLHSRGSNQSDASFGLTAAVCEALLQSHAGEISLLPALPPSWADGAIDGLRARGGYEIAMEWKGGVLQSVILKNPSSTARALKLRCGARTMDVTVRAGETLRLNADLAVAN